MSVRFERAYELDKMERMDKEEMLREKNGFDADGVCFDGESCDIIDHIARENCRRMGEFCDSRHPVVEEVISRLCDYPGLPVAERVKRILDSGCEPVNTYPFGHPTGEIYPVWIGVNNGRRSVAFRRLLDRAVDYCRTPNTVPDKSKEVNIFTDIWNDRMEEDVIRALHPFYDSRECIVRIWFMNSYGVTGIPFYMSYSGCSLPKGCIRVRDYKNYGRYIEE